MEFLELGYSDERFKSSVNEDLHCPICMNVLKEPVHCGPNEHYFCTKCIERHLSNTRNCPTCKEVLSLNTFKPPSRFVTNRLCELVIRCDNFDRGCQKFVKLGELGNHVLDCDFSPVKCSNERCSSVVSKSDLEEHESELCEFRKRKCSDCDEMRKEVNELKISLEETKEQLKMVLEVRSDIVSMKQALALTESPTFLREDVIVLGGGETNNTPLSTVEMFMWSSKEWVSLNSMKENRTKASSFVYENHVVASGGLTTRSPQSGLSVSNSMEKLSLSGIKSSEWTEFPCVLPIKRSAHKCVVYQDRLLVIGGYDEKKGKFCDAIHEVRLTAPYPSKFLSRMPCQRRYHGAEIFGDKVVIAGGTSTGSIEDCLNSVIEYDVTNNKCNKLPPLPFPVTGMATVKWRDQLILIGGVDGDGKKLRKVIMYDVKTGRITKLPSMKHEREGCMAITTGNVIVVMGGFNFKQNRLNSVECFNFDTYSWEELPPMAKHRSYASAVVKPVNI